MSVRRGSVKLSADGKPILNWNGQPDLTRLHDERKVPDGAKLFIGSSNGVFQFQPLVLTPR